MSFAYFLYEVDLLPLTLFFLCVWALPIFAVIFWERFLSMPELEQENSNHYTGLEESAAAGSFLSTSVWERLVIAFLFIVETVLLLPVASAVFHITAPLFLAIMAVLAISAELLICFYKPAVKPLRAER